MSATKVTLRKRELPSGKITLYLDFYPPIRNPRTMEMSRREYLGIYLTKSPRTPEERNVNAEKTKQAEAIRAQRELSLINEQFGFIDKAKQKMDFLAYFKEKLPNQDQKWEKIYKHFDKFVQGSNPLSLVDPKGDSYYKTEDGEEGTQAVYYKDNNTSEHDYSQELGTTSVNIGEFIQREMAGTYALEYKGETVATSDSPFKLYSGEMDGKTMTSYTNYWKDNGSLDMNKVVNDSRMSNYLLSSDQFSDNLKSNVLNNVIRNTTDKAGKSIAAAGGSAFAIVAAPVVLPPLLEAGSATYTYVSVNALPVTNTVITNVIYSGQNAALYLSSSPIVSGGVDAAVKIGLDVMFKVDSPPDFYLFDNPVSDVSSDMLYSIYYISKETINK